MATDPYAASLTYCLICEAENQTSASVCRKCAAPLALIEEAVLQDREPRMVSIIGGTNVGKTVYLGYLLDMLSRRGGDFDAVPKGPYSVNLQQTVVSYLSHRFFPPKTPNEVDQWNWAYYQVAKRTTEKAQWYDLVMPDMAGEALAAELDNPRTYNVIRSLMEKSAGALLLVDAALAAAGSSQPDFFALKLLSYVDHLLACKRDERVPSPVAVVLCKADHCPQAFDAPEEFAKTNLNRLWNLCDSRFERVGYFAASVVGAIGYLRDEDDVVVPIPLHSAPRGILEPFQWIISQL